MGRKGRSAALLSAAALSSVSFLSVAFLSVLAPACATSHYARPLGRGNAALQASLGGPLVSLSGTPIAAPILEVGGGYGATDRWDVFARADVTAAAYGDLHLEPGAAYHAVVREGGPVPTVTLAGSLHVMTDFEAARVGPQLSALAAWRVGASRRHLVYVGADAGALVPGRVRALVGPLAGGELRVGRRAGLVLEASWLAPWYDVRPLAPTWISPGDHGYLLVLLGCNVYFGDVK
ncbi:MAG TPA: hypothetical protein VHL80_03995 [Polyangia bacterium]|nr:hypothetical protein [Polyangia bacterium]